jgi:hypothetical protein
MNISPLPEPALPCRHFQVEGDARVQLFTSEKGGKNWLVRTMAILVEGARSRAYTALPGLGNSSKSKVVGQRRCGKIQKTGVFYSYNYVRQTLKSPNRPML